MKRAGLILLLTMALMACFTIATMAEPGLQIGLGYNSWDSTSSLSYDSIGILDISTPCKMYTLSLDYGVNDWLSFSGKYSTGDTDLASILGLIDIPQDNRIWQVEAALQWSIGEKAKLGAVIGYLDYETTTSLSVLASLTTNISGAYIGPILTYAPNDTWEFGASYRYMINADGDLSWQVIIPTLNGTYPIDDPSYAVAEIYAKTQLADNWALRTSYTLTSLDWNIGSIKVGRDLSGLSVLLQYKF